MANYEKAIKARIKPIINKAIELIERQDDEAFLGRMHILAAQIQGDESVDAAVELAILALTAEEFGKIK